MKLPLKPVKVSPRLLAVAQAGIQTRAILTMFAISGALILSMLPAMSDFDIWPDSGKLGMLAAAAVTTLFLGLGVDCWTHLKRKR